MLEAAAKKSGLDYRYIPVISGQLQQAQVQAFTTALSEMSAPVLAFCRTGARSSTLWALHVAGTADAILASASAAGYDLSALRPHPGDAAHGH
jgi:sulfide:quinone oxidoreductase